LPGRVGITARILRASGEVEVVSSSEQILEFRDTSLPLILSLRPSKARVSGGALVLVGFTGFCKGISSCPPLPPLSAVAGTSSSGSTAQVRLKP